MTFNTILLDNNPADYLIWRQGSGSTVEIFDVQIYSQRGVGRGRELVRILFATVPETTTMVWAITRVKNEVAQQWYESMEFRVVGILRRFYSEDDGADAIMYGRSPRGRI